MKKTLSLGLIAISILFISCEKEVDINTINEIENIESTGKIADEINMEEEPVKEEKKIIIEEKVEILPETTTATKTEETKVDDSKNEETISTPVSTIKNFSITAQQWSFSPATITVNNGDTVKLSIKSTDVDHGFFLADFGVSETLKAGTTTNVSFIANKSGTFSFSCSVFCGSSHSSMVGTLIVK